jgi:hypothetical protein
MQCNEKWSYAACCKRSLADHVRGLLSLTSRIIQISQLSLQVGAADIPTNSNVFRFSRVGWSHSVITALSLPAQ